MTGRRDLGIAACLAMLLAGCGWGGVSSSELDLTIEAAYVTQGSQTRDGAVPLVEGRDGWVRVLVRANQPNNAWPDVRVTLLEGGAPAGTFTVPAPRLVPFATDEGSMGHTWNVRLPGAEVKPGRSLRVELDPDEAYPDADRSDNAWPAPGASAPLDVRAAPPLRVMLVPLQVTSFWGYLAWTTIDDADLATLEETLRTLLPLGAIELTVHAPVATGINMETEYYPEDAAYGAIQALQAAEAATYPGVHYIGFLPWEEAYYVNWGGLGAHPGLVSMMWDYAFDPREQVAPHELGHNFGLWHTPCAPAGSMDPASIDRNWPTDAGHGSAHLGAWGMDVAAGEPKDPARYFDLMSYCNPGWMSDYSWVNAIALREDAAAAAAPLLDAPPVPGPAVLLSGRIDSGGASLDEPLLLEVAGQLAAGGSERMEARDAAGALLFSARFATTSMADGDDGAASTFAFTVPVTAEVAGRIAELRWTRGGAAVAHHRVAEMTAAPRDPQTGELRSVRRGGAGGRP